jgi:hypothetical protein
MAVSAFRTLALADYLPTISRGVVISAAPMWWPPKQNFEELDFSLDATAAMQEVGDTFVKASARVSRSGLTDAIVTDLTVSGSVLTVWIDLGSPGTFYSVLIQAWTAVGRSFNWLGYLQVLSPAFEIGTPAVAATPSQTAYDVVVDTSGSPIADTNGAQLLRAPVTWTNRMVSDTSGRTIRNARGLPLLLAA